jgi:hypothetical protein
VRQDFNVFATGYHNYYEFQFRAAGSAQWKTIGEWHGMSADMNGNRLGAQGQPWLVAVWHSADTMPAELQYYVEADGAVRYILPPSAGKNILVFQGSYDQVINGYLAQAQDAGIAFNQARIEYETHHQNSNGFAYSTATLWTLDAGPWSDLRDHAWASQGEMKLRGLGSDFFRHPGNAIRISEGTSRYIYRDQRCFVAGTMIDMADGTRKPIERIKAGDWVASFDEQGSKVPGRVTRTFQNHARCVLDLHGLSTTPGHAFRWGDGPSHMQFAPIVDILRRDGVIVDRDGELIRAATNCTVGSIGDQLIWAVAGPVGPDGFVRVAAKGRIRLGTRFILPDGSDWSVLDTIEANGWLVTPDGLLKRQPGDTHGFPYHWSWTDGLPQPEDYVLKRSGVTLRDLYEDGEWEVAQRAMTATPPLSGADRAAAAVQASAPSLETPPTGSAGSLPNRVQRRAAEGAARRKARRTFRGNPMH